MASAETDFSLPSIFVNVMAAFVRTSWTDGS
uniref:Uncharacterized protein n=1 Tax=Rhizophora mucronata TaxID=61149 RepID=A0A2P2PKI8_RHIMU